MNSKAFARAVVAVLIAASTCASTPAPSSAASPASVDARYLATLHSYHAPNLEENDDGQLVQFAKIECGAITTGQTTPAGWERFLTGIHWQQAAAAVQVASAVYYYCPDRSR